MAVKTKTKLNILFTASEAEPFFKVGGLGDYAGSLPAALNRLPQDSNYDLEVRVVLPLHYNGLIENFKLEKLFPLEINSLQGPQKGTVFTKDIDGQKYFFIQQNEPPPFSKKVYGENEYENAIKYAFFSMAVIALLPKLKWQPDIIHANDWHTALICHLLRHKADLNTTPASMLVIHNMPFMGYGSEKILLDYEIPPRKMTIFPPGPCNYPCQWEWHPRIKL